MLSALDIGANASSVHSDGRQARAVVEAARAQVAALVGASADQVIFTSGATEAAQLALSPRLRRGKDEFRLKNLLVSAIEHPCVLNGGRFDPSNITTLPVSSEGVLDLDALAAILGQRNDNEPFLAAIMLANNETGVIQPVREAGKPVHQAGGYLLVDAVQAAGRIALDMSRLGADFLVLTSHKIGGPQGVGALVLADKSITPEPLIKGGGHEHHLRAGTENVAAIAGFGAACGKAVEQLEYMRETLYVRNQLEGRLKELSKSLGNRIGPLKIVGENSERLANTCCFAVSGINAETALISLDLDGISVSSGSACSSGRVEVSHVLRAMGLDEQAARGAIRVSIGWNTTAADTEKFLEAWSSYLHRLV